MQLNHLKDEYRVIIPDLILYVMSLKPGFDKTVETRNPASMATSSMIDGLIFSILRSYMTSSRMAIYKNTSRVERQNETDTKSILFLGRSRTSQN